MPKVLERDPAWLVGASTPGLDLFRTSKEAAAAAAAQHQSHSTTQRSGPLRRIAHRGCEAFVAVGNELRWSDLAALRDPQAPLQRSYRVLKTPVHREITQLTISPSGDYIAILTSHTCHVCILPTSSHLRPQDPPLRLKAFQLGPTAHVLEQAPLVSAIWHPLSPSGSCLVTITLDACVRLWELDSQNRSSFDEPGLAVDLKKLGNATSMQADLGASKYGTNKGFSPDEVEMQVAAASFGGQGRSDEHGWASMTLWVAMTEGDVYALCPFLPSRWFAPSSLLPTLSTSVTENARAIKFDPNATERDRRVVDEQCKWLKDIDAQQPIIVPGQTEFDDLEVYSRPDCLSAVPKLQGPFSIVPEPDFGEITDIYVIGPKVDDQALFGGDVDDEDDEEGLSVSIICLATSTNEVHVCLDLDGVEAEWLPKKRARTYALDDVEDEKELLLFETLDLATNETEDNGWPTFTSSPLDRCALFVSYPMGVCGISFRPWISLLEDELATRTDAGAGLRLNVVLESSATVVDQPIKMPGEPEEDINTAIALLDPTIGFLVLTLAPNAPYAALLAIPAAHPYLPDAPAITGLLPAPEPRAPYRPPPAFEQPSQLPHLLKVAQEKNILGSDLKREVRFSPATLHLLTEAHRVVSAETHTLALAASDLFLRCERMRAELQEQVRRVAEIAERVDNVTGEEEADAENENEEEEEPLAGREKIEQRIQQTQHTTTQLNARIDALRRKMVRLGGRQPNAKELAFVDEVVRLQHSIGAGTDSELNSPEEQSPTSPISSSLHDPARPDALASRFSAVKALHTQLAEDVAILIDKKGSMKGKTGESEEGNADTLSNNVNANPSGNPSAAAAAAANNASFKRQKLAQVMALLERETALVNAVTERLGRLKG